MERQAESRKLDAIALPLIATGCGVEQAYLTAAAELAEKQQVKQFVDTLFAMDGVYIPRHP